MPKFKEVADGGSDEEMRKSQQNGSEGPPKWRDPNGRIFPGPGYAWIVMTRLKGKQQ